MESQIIVISVYYVIEAFFNFKIVATRAISAVVNAGVGEYVEKAGIVEQREKLRIQWMGCTEQ